MAASDEDLVMGCATGDREAFKAIYDRFAPRVFGLALKLVGQRDLAEDVLQEVMAETWARCSRYDSSLGSVETWLLMIARSRSIDAVRRRRSQEQKKAAIADQPPRVRGAENVSRPAGLEPKLRAALDDLPTEQKAVIDLAFYRGLTRDQIAETLNIPVGTVKTRIRLAIRHLAEQHKELEPTNP